jgi:hypothetical protein
LRAESAAPADSGDAGEPAAPFPVETVPSTVPVSSDAFVAAVDLIERARIVNGEHAPESVAIGILMERHRLSPVAARRMLASMAAGRGRSESALGAEIVAAATLLSGPLSPTA